MTAKKLYIKTYGCQMNVYDSNRMRDVLAPLGFTQSDEPENADLVILNTCHIREKAEDKVFSDLGRIHKEQKRMQTEGKQMLVAVGGCVGQAQGEEIIKRAPYVSMVFGPQSYHHLPEMVTKAMRGQGHLVELEFPAVQKFDYLPEETASHGVADFLAVQEGCDKFCTFCVVPYTRGAEYSRPVATVEKEARQLAAQGVVDLTLLGQNVNGYHGQGEGGEWNFAKLLKHLAKIDGLERLRYMTSHPRDMDDELIAAHGEEEKIMPYLHLPVQSGSDRILKMMNRKHTAEFYLTIIEKLRRARPDIALSSDFIVGFPGESERDFEDTMRLVETVGFAQAYSFKYSPRPGTPAALDEHQIPEEVKIERLARLQTLITRQQQSFNQTTVGRVLPVLFDKPGKFAGQLLGKSPYMQSVYLTAPEDYMNRIAHVRITEAYQNSVTGELVTDAVKNAA